MIRQPDGYVLAYRDGSERAVPPKSFERLVRSDRTVGFWRVWLRKDGA